MLDLGMIAAARGQPETALAALADAYRAEVGFDMLSVMVYDLENMRARRIYSTSDTHPAGQFKSLLMSDWIVQVVKCGEMFIADCPADFKAHYIDWKILEQMGLQSAANFPVRINGSVAGTVNLQSTQWAYFTPTRCSAAASLHGLAALALLLHADCERAMLQSAMT